MSSSAPTNLLALVAVVLLGGCMKIYPDPELPDIVARWNASDCREQTGDVRIVVADPDGVDVMAETIVPCGFLEVRFDDVARDQYRVDGYLLDLDGDVFSSNQSFADLRDGISERVELFFTSFVNFRVQWEFEPGTDCTTLDVQSVAIDLAFEASQTFDTRFEIDCRFTPFFEFLRNGSYRVRLRARSASATVAVSDIVAIDIMGQQLTDAGTLLLTPCGDACPEPPGVRRPSSATDR